MTLFGRLAFHESLSENVGDKTKQQRSPPVSLEGHGRFPPKNPKCFFVKKSKNPLKTQQSKQFNNGFLLVKSHVEKTLTKNRKSNPTTQWEKSPTQRKINEPAQPGVHPKKHQCICRKEGSLYMDSAVCWQLAS